MKTRYIISLLLIFAASFAASAQRRYEVTVNDFKELRVDNSIPVDYYCKPDSAGIALLYTTDEQADWILFDNNRKGKLTVLTDADYPGVGSLPRVVVYSSSLEKVVNSGDSLVKVHDVPECKKFKAVLIGNGRLVGHDIKADKIEGSIDSGNGQLVLSGSCAEASLRNVGTGTIQADQLTANSIKATIVGTGSIGCNPIESLIVKGMGSGTVYYRKLPSKFKNYGIGIKHVEM